MKAVVLSAVPTEHASLRALAEALDTALSHAGYDSVTTFELTTTKLAFCQGELDCWVKTPGRCRAHDAETKILEAVHAADALVFLGPLTFGGHSHVLKRAVDRLICLLEPFFTKRLSLTHHEVRYEKHQGFFAVAWAPRVTAELATTFAELNDANAINFLAPACGALVVDDANVSSWPALLSEMLEKPRVPGTRIHARAPLRDALIAAATPDPQAGGPLKVESAAILVGSPKQKGTSASEVMAHALVKRLAVAGVTSELHFVTEFVHADARAVHAAELIAARDLFVLVTPLYVDAFPSLTTHALELVANARARVSRPASFVVLVNCGFPEPEQNRTALRIGRHFAEQAGYAFGGGLPLGGGGVVTPDRVLDEPHGPTAHIVRALDLAAPALALTGALPLAAIEAISQSVLPDALYRLIGDLGWRWQAHKNGVAQRDLHARPLERAPV